MQQRQLRLGDILDDYCPRERRLTNHVIVAMIADEVKQTRCTTCDADHEYKHAKIPRQRRKGDVSALVAPVTIAPKKVPPETVASPPAPTAEDEIRAALGLPNSDDTAAVSEPGALEAGESDADEDREGPLDEGIVHRKLIRAQLPRHEGQPTATRPGPDFTIRQPNSGRPGRFRPRNQRGGMAFQDNRGNSFGGNARGAAPRPHGGPQRPGRHQPQGQGRKRSK